MTGPTRSLLWKPGAAGALRLLPRRYEHTWEIYASLLFLVFFFAGLRDASVLEAAAALAATVVFLGLYFFAHWLRPPRPLWPASGMIGLGLAFLPYNPGASVFFCYAATTASLLLPFGWALVAVAASLASFLSAGAALHFGEDALAINSLVVLCTSAIYMQVRRGEEARAHLYWREEELAELHKASERRRIAQDLHDHLGHALSLMAVKAELARKLGGARAHDELGDIAATARETLAQVRHVIGGHYQTAFGDEIKRAETLLRGAEIKTSVRVDLVSPLPPRQDAMFALILREAVTNIIRHSRARNCEINLRADAGQACLSIHDDGRGARSFAGMGVRGMRERAEQMGAVLSIEGEGGVRIEIVAPISTA
jgi:two-component system sensor histidine kinase DesK